MTKTNSVIIILSVSLLVLFVFCLFFWPLVTGKYDRKAVNVLNSVSKSQTGQNLIGHYQKRLDTLVKYRIGLCRNLKPDEHDKMYFILAGLIFAGVAGLFVSLVSLALFIIYGTTKRDPALSKSKLFLILLLVILNGMAVRLVLASAHYGNFDMQSFDIVGHIVSLGGNVYAQTPRYNYSPVWFTILGVLKEIQFQHPSLPFHFIVRSFLSCVDLLTLVFLLLIAKRENISLVKTSVFFFLNPVLFLLTGFHGQFENLAILMVVIGLYAYLKLKHRPVLRTLLLWIFAGVGMIIKHNIFYELIICLHSAIKRYYIKIPLFIVSVCVFLALFIPYWHEGSKGIVQNVFKYSSHSSGYGIISLFACPHLKYAFILGLLFFPLLLKNKDIIQRCLLGALFFLSFTTGIGIQYFMLPVAFGALRPSRPFLFYSLAASLFILGNDNNVFLPGFHLFKWNIVWVGAILWFALELYNNRKAEKVSA